MPPLFVTFLQCSFDDNWQFMAKKAYVSGQVWDMERFTKLSAKKHDASVNLVDASKREIRMKFIGSAIVGVSDGMFYCNSDDVRDTKVGKPLTQ